MLRQLVHYKSIIGNKLKSRTFLNQKTESKVACFSGKDPTKIDRSAAYMARYIAKNIVFGCLEPNTPLEMLERTNEGRLEAQLKGIKFGR